jgi:hypothetical protein
MNSIPWVIFSIIAVAAIMVFAVLGAAFVIRLLGRTTLPVSDEVGGISTVLRKLRNREPMTDDEVALAQQATADRASFMALCIPATLFSIGCFFVFGSLAELHGAKSSERTFLGVFPMLTATNFSLQLLRSSRLKKRAQRS